MLDYKNTQCLLAAIEQNTHKASSFLRDRYFPTNDATDIFTTNEVLVEYKSGNKKLAPFVTPRKNGKVVFRDGYDTKSYAPANIAPKRPITIDDLKRKGFGEALFSQMTPEERQTALVLLDSQELDEMIARREEAMAAELLTTNGIVMKHYADKGDEYEEKEIRFYNGVSDPTEYTVSTPWGSASADIVKDLYAMILALTEAGCDASELVVGSDVAQAIINNDSIQKLLDIRNYNVGTVEPIALPTGAARLCRLNIYGNELDILTYNQTYENEAGIIVPYIAADQIVLTSPNAGRTAYGAISQVEQTDGEMHTYAGKRVPHYVADADSNSRSLTLTSAPLMMPNKKNAWIHADVLS